MNLSTLNFDNEDSFVNLIVIRIKHWKINYVCPLCQYVNQPKILSIIKNVRLRLIQGTFFRREGVPIADLPLSSCTPVTVRNTIFST